MTTSKLNEQESNVLYIALTSYMNAVQGTMTTTASDTHRESLSYYLNSARELRDQIQNIQIVNN